MLFKKEKAMLNLTGENTQSCDKTRKDPDNIFTFLWCVNVRLHSVNYPLREAGLLRARRAEVKDQRCKRQTLHFTLITRGL